jgi:hypothetical protein
LKTVFDPEDGLLGIPIASISKYPLFWVDGVIVLVGYGIGFTC